jgi:hypothetical protein
MWKKLKNTLFEGTVEVPMPMAGRFKSHDMVYYQWTPNPDATYKKLDTLIESFHGLLNDSLFKNFKEGQEVTSIELYSENKRSTYIVGFPSSQHEYFAERLRYAYKGSGINPMEDARKSFTMGLTSMAGLCLKEHAFRALNLKMNGEFTEALLNAYDLVQDGEKLWTQILLEPLDSDATAELNEKYQMYLEGEEVIAGVGAGLLLAKGLRKLSDVPKNLVLDELGQKPAGKSKTPRLPQSEQKACQNIFRAEIRLAAQSNTIARRNLLINSVVNAFKTMNGDNQWKLESIVRKVANLDSMNQRKMPPFGSSVILCHDEVKAFYQTPTKDMESETLEIMTPEEKGIDKRLMREGIIIGHPPHDESLLVRIPVKDHDDGAKVRAWISSPGGGKSTQIEAFTEGAAQLGHGFAVYDGKDGVMFHRTLSTMSAQHNEERFEIIDYENEKRPPMFNFSALGGEGQSAGSMFAELFELLFSGKDLITSKSFAIKAAQSVFSDPMSTFLEFIQMMRDDAFRKTFVPKLKKTKPDLYLWWKQEFPKISDTELNRMVRPILDRMENDILYNEKMSSILCGRGGQIQYYKWMQDSKLVFVNAPLGCFTEPELKFIMAMHNFASWNATLSRRKITQSGVRAPLFHLIFDEPQNYMDATPTIQTAIAKARAYSVSYNFFIQEAEQIIEKSPSLWKCIMGMSPMLMIGPVSENTAKLVSKELDVKVDDILRIKQLPYHWWYKAYADKAAVPSQIIKAVTPIDKLKPPIPLQDRTRLKEKNAIKFGPQTVKDIQQDISARNFKMTVDEYKKLLASYDQEENGEEGVEWDESDEAVTNGKK